MMRTDIRIEVLHALQELDARHLGHPLIRNHHGDLVAGEQLEPLGCAGGGQDAIAIAAQYALQRRQDPGLVVDQQQRAPSSFAPEDGSASLRWSLSIRVQSSADTGGEK
jgi:hypothetical protein